MKTKTFAVKMTALAAASALLVTGCASDKSGSNADKDSSSKSSASMSKDEALPAGDYAETPYDQVKDGGELTTGIYEIPEQENAFHADMTSPTRTLWNWYNPQLVLFDAEGNFKLNPDYLTDVKDEIKDGNTVVTYTINEKATFNDGTPIDWTAFDATWYANNGKNKAFNVNSTDGYERITSVKKGENDKQVVVTFDGAYPWWKGLFNVICHPALKDPKNFNDFVNKIHPEWGAGPYIPETFDFKKGQVIFVRNDKWWGKKGKLDRRIYRQMETQAATNAFKNGEIDAVGAGSKDRYATIKDMPGIEIRKSALPSTVLFELSAKSPVLADIAVRKAVFEAIDRTTIGKIESQGLPYKETPPGSFNLYPFQKGYQDNYGKVIPKTGPEVAGKTLEGAGYKKGDDGFYAKDGKKVAIRYVLFGSDSTSKAIAQAVQKMLKDSGIDASIDQRPSSDFSNVTSNRDFDILPLRFSGTDPYGVAYFGQTYKSDSNLNLSSTGTKELDAKIEELQKLPTEEEQIKRANELEVEAFQRYGLMPVANGADIVAVKKGLVNAGGLGFAVIPVETIGWKK